MKTTPSSVDGEATNCLARRSRILHFVVGFVRRSSLDVDALLGSTFNLSEIRFGRSSPRSACAKDERGHPIASLPASLTMVTFLFGIE